MSINKVLFLHINLLSFHFLFIAQNLKKKILLVPPDSLNSQNIKEVSQWLKKTKFPEKNTFPGKETKVFLIIFILTNKICLAKKNNAFPKNNSLLVEREDCSIQSVSFHWLNNIKPRIKETSYCKYQYAVVKYINPYIGNLKIYEITNKYIYDFANRLLIEGGAKHQGLSPKSVNDIICILKSILRFAADLCGVEELHFKPIQLRNTEAPLHTLTRQEQQILTI